MKTIGVYKTNIDDPSKANTIVKEIRQAFPGSDPCIDFEDCDKVLRVEHLAPEIDERKIKTILKKYGYKMDVLP